MGSKASQSTGFTSHESDTSRDHALQSRGPGGYRTPTSLREYDSILARRQPLSLSPPATPSQSTNSLLISSAEPSSKRHFRRIKGLSVLRLHRVSSSAPVTDRCPHCLPDAPYIRRAVHILPCGHRICTQGLRNIINATIESKDRYVPCCCSTPIPGSLVQNVMTEAEQTALLDKLELWDEASSVAPSVVSEPRGSVTYQRSMISTNDSRTASNEFKADSILPSSEPDMGKIMERSDFQHLRRKQEEQRDRFLGWIESRRRILEARHERLRQELQAKLESAIEDLIERHGIAMSDAEDKQVKAEADMRKMHEQEKRDNATALKHMEAYCAGTYGTGESHNRTVTDQDRAELEKARRIRDQMDAKHESAINVLRGEQNRRMKLRAQRQDREEQDLRKAQRKEELDLERSLAIESHTLDDFAAVKRQKLRMLWRLQSAILLRRAEIVTGLTIPTRAPSLDWQTDDGDGKLPPSPPSTAGASISSEHQQLIERNTKAGISTSTSWLHIGKD
ncbi:hypothetical protein M433DRAFT_64151 [Acidomyces richmondensis BFW]|nr:MAG: hypothetical protein FE78DRAFT_144060 [Acidomyces sp. 'richmondensis']KYG46920.1 hypothetical protein M433DRAFT_64151 [Acidomyces richmondensis BFW]